jgi:hypothetical protein
MAPATRVPSSWGNGTIKVTGFKNGYVGSETSSAIFDLTVSTPVISPNGAVLTDVVEVNLSTETDGAELFWTIDGKDPSRLSTPYNGPFLLGTNGTLKVKGFKNGFIGSQTVSAAFNMTMSNPTVNPSSASSTNPVTVTFNSSTSGAQFFWTIDGTEPTRSSPLYAGPFPLGTNGTIRVKAIKDGFVDSQISSGIFNLSVALPVVTPEPGTNINSLTITLAAAASATSL